MNEYTGPSGWFADELARLGRRALQACEARGWRTDWSARGAYLFLESAEFIEALRGKGDSTPEEEMADVLTVLLSAAAAYKLNFAEVLNCMDKKDAAIRAFEVGDGKRARP